MALNDRVQLKREEVVGDDIVLSDINPKTNTRSIDDPTSGETLNKTIEEMWQMINNKLSRIVNSVNGRTGVVVLSPEDVGLDQVDNVSLADIKRWVINRLKQEFGNKRIALFDNLNEVRTYISDNDESHADKPFYSHHGFDGDYRGYIGYIWWDEGKGALDETHMVIDTVGRTDNSIIYNEDINGRNLTGGGIGVNIWKYEDALELYNDISGEKADSGLRINKDILVPKLYYFEGMYGNGQPDDPNSLLWSSSGIPSDAPRVDIYLDGTIVNGYQYLRLETRVGKKFNVGDLIICDFKDYRNDDGTAPTGMFLDLMNRNPAIGRVNVVPNLDDNKTHYRIDFYTIGIFPGWGIDEKKRYHLTPDGSVPSSAHAYRSLDIKLASGTIPQEPAYSHDMSGLTVVKKNKLQSSSDNTDHGYVVMPYGVENVMLDKNVSDGGLRVNTDMSLCILPYDLTCTEWHVGRSGCCIATNWIGDFGWKINTPRQNELKVHPSAIGINLMKSVEEGVPSAGDENVKNYRFTNLSGLRISKPTQTVTREFLGLGTDDTGIETGGPAIDAPTSGGLSINVGDFLEIKPGDVPEDDDYAHYYDGGKVNVRINTDQGFKNIDNRINLDILDKTLYFVGSHLSVRYDRLHGIDSERLDDQLITGLYVKLAENSGLKFNGTGEIIISLDDKKGIDVDENGNLFVKAGDGVSFDENGNLTVNAVAGGNSLTFTDANGNSIVYAPSNDPVEITLGRGLQITE